jgi:GMP synthase-like glutamine amidotransferase
MKPVAILRHAPTEGPGHFASFLDRHAIPWRVVAIDAGEAVPAGAGGYAGLAFLGGPMSVNDELPWIAPALALIGEARERGVPVIGHCLGGQLMAKAFGGAVSANPVREIGWGEVRVAGTPAARDWFGDIDAFTSFHWHGETFSIPAGASRIAGSRWCANQAFVLGPHLGMQCHVEMTAEMVELWCRAGARELERHAGASVQSAAAIRAALPERIAALHAVADRLYTRWIAGLAR